MNTNSRFVRVFLFLTTMFGFALAATAQIPDGARLPYSGGVLVARAIRSGLMQRPGQSGLSNLGSNPNLNCSPAPCVLPNVQASGIGTSPANETPVAVNPKNPKQLLTGSNDYNCPNIQGFYTSNDGGTTWTRTCMGNLSPGAGDGDPGVGYDLNGNAYITGIDGGTTDGSDIIFEKSTDNGATWSNPAAAVKPLFSGGFTDKDWLQIDVSPTSSHKNNLYISVTQFDPSSNSAISVSHSSDGGATWTTVQVDTMQTYPAIDQFSDIAVAKNGTVYVSWMRCTANGPTSDCGGTAATLVISKSTNGGNTWSTPKTIATVNLAPDTCGAFYGCLPNTNERVSNIPSIGVDNSTGPFRGHVYAGFYTWNPNAYMEEEVAHSANGGVTWSTPKRVTPLSDNHDQFFNWLNVSSDGVVGVTWLDRRDDPANVKYEAFWSTSTNGGGTFLPNKKLSSVASDPHNDGFSGGFMGDYTGNAWAGEKLYATYCDTRSLVDCQDELVGYFDKP